LDRLSVSVLVDFFEPGLVRVGMGVGLLAFVLVFVFVLDVLVLVSGMRVGVSLSVVRVLVGVRCFVGVLVGHDAPG